GVSRHDTGTVFHDGIYLLNEYCSDEGIGGLVIVVKNSVIVIHDVFYSQKMKEAFRKCRKERKKFFFNHHPVIAAHRENLEKSPEISCKGLLPRRFSRIQRFEVTFTEKRTHVHLKPCLFQIRKILVAAESAAAGVAGIFSEIEDFHSSIYIKYFPEIAS